MEKKKYSVLLFPNFGPSPDFSTLTELDKNTLVCTGRFADLLKSDDTKHWKEWLGSIIWEALFEHDSLFFISLADSSGSEAELQDLSGELYRSMALAFEWTPPEDRCAIFCGDCEVTDKKIQFTKVQSFSRTDLWFRPAYFDADYNFTDYDAEAENQGTVKAAYGVCVDFRKVFPAGKGPHLLGIAFLSFEESIRNGRLEFKLPNQVRAIEAIIALSKHHGAADFAERAKRFAPSKNAFYSYTAEEIALFLKDAYNIRSACVHGMPFDLKIKDRLGTDYKKVLPKYEYLVESVARNAIKWAMRSADFVALADDRSALEAAWAASKF